ncbi:MAG: hypothetical protein QXV83_01745 [Candidatus Anstonellaceae archaeon]
MIRMENKEVQKEFEELAQINREVVEIEKKTSFLMDELINRTKKSKEIDSREIFRETYNLAKYTTKIISEFKQKKDLRDFDKYATELKKVEKRANFLLSKLGDSLIIKNEKKLNGEFEAVINNLHKIKRGMDVITLPHIEEKNKKILQEQLKHWLYSTKQRVKIIEDVLKNDQELKKSPLYHNLLQIANKSNEIIQLKEQIEEEIKQRKIYDYARAYITEFKKFFVKELEGKIYIDHNIIKLTSLLSGRVEEYPVDSRVEKALELLFQSNPQLIKILKNMAQDNSAIVGEFKLTHEPNGLKVDLELKHRKISFDVVIANPLRIKILI